MAEKTIANIPKILLNRLATIYDWRGSLSAGIIVRSEGFSFLRRDRWIFNDREFFAAGAAEPLSVRVLFATIRTEHR